jgi:hypothetical protein
MPQLISLWQHLAPAPVTDVALVGETAVLALGPAGLQVVQPGITRLLPWRVEHLVGCTSKPGVLMLGPLLKKPDGYPLRQWIPGPVERWKRRVATLEPPWDACSDLGEVEIQGWCPTWDGDRWALFEGDDVRVMLRTGELFQEEWTYRSFLPTAIVPHARGLWLETTSIGASHYEILSFPDLQVLASGDLKSPPIQFPPERLLSCLRDPSGPSSLFVVDAFGLPTTVELGRPLHHPQIDRSRLVTLEGIRIVEFPERPKASGIQAGGHLALAWVAQTNGLLLYLIDLATAQLFHTLQWAGAQRACASWERQQLLVADDTGRVALYRVG